MDTSTNRFLAGLFLFLSVTGLFSCKKNTPPFPAPMGRAEQLIFNYPDSALTLLESLRDSVNALPEATRMYYDLMYLKARDKCYILHTSDSLIKRIVRYYEETGERDKLMEAYYYMGRVYLDMHDSPRALSYFQQALKLSEGSIRYDIITRIYSQTGTLYAYQHVYDEALKMHKKSYETHILGNDTMGMPYPLRDIARIYTVTGKKDSALLYYHKAYEKARQVGGGKKWYNIPLELASVYLELKEYDQVRKYTTIALVDHSFRNHPPIYKILGEMYLELDSLDSAFYYLEKALDTTSPYVMRAAYEKLSEVEEKRQHYKQAVHYNHLSRMWTDSVQKITAYETIRQMRELYNYQKWEEENQYLKSINEKRKIQFYQMILLFSAAFVAGFWFFKREKRKKNEQIEKEKQLRQFQEIHYRQSQAYILQNETKIKQLEEQLQASEKQKDTIHHHLITAQKELLEATNRQITLCHKEKEWRIEDFKRSDIYLKFHLAATSDTLKITEKDWSTLQKGIDEAYANFTHTLYSLYPSLSTIELRICYLIKISIQVTGMSHLLGRTKSSVSTARSRLYQKLTNEKGSPEKLDAYILRL